jgi:hypothetical protein
MNSLKFHPGPFTACGQATPGSLPARRPAACPPSSTSLDTSRHTIGCTRQQARTGRGIHGLPKVSCGPTMPDPYMPCGRATPQMALRPFGGGPSTGWAACGRLLPPWIPHAVRACSPTLCSCVAKQQKRADRHATESLKAAPKS